ncbi:hypothetical protein D3C77_446150 [compost metagenome]
MRIAAEFIAPRPQAAGRKVQAVLLGKANRTMHLVRHRGRQAGGFARAYLGHGHIERQAAGAARLGLHHLAGAVQGHFGGGTGRADGAGHVCQLLLDGLEGADGLAELHPLVGVRHRLVEARLQRADQHARAHQGAEHPHRLAHIGQLQATQRIHGRRAELQRIALLTSKVAARFDADLGLAQIHQGNTPIVVGHCRPAATARPRHIGTAAIEHPGCGQFQLRRGTGLQHRQGALGHLDTGPGQQQPGQQGFVQRHRCLPVTHAPQHRADIEPGGRVVVGYRCHQGLGQAVLDQLSPERMSRHTGIELRQHLGCHVVVEQTLDAVGDQSLQ